MVVQAWNGRRRAAALTAVAAVFGVAWFAMGPHPAYAATSAVSGCTKADLTNAITAAGPGGTVDYVVDCTGANAVAITGTVTISSSVTISGNGHAVTLDGGHTTQLLNIAVNLTVHLDQLTFADGSFISGGAIAISGSTVTIADSTFVDNTAANIVAPATGGAILSLTVQGGGTTYSPVLTVTNSTFDHNAAAVGSAIVGSGTTTIVNSTFVGNTNSALLAQGTFTLTNTVLAQSGTANCSGTVTDGGGNLADDASCAFTSAHSRNSVSDAALNLGALADNGGPTQTDALLTGSAAIDVTTGCPATDQRALARFDNGESACDAGAYEFQDPVPTMPTPTPTAAPPVPNAGGAAGQPDTPAG